MDGQPIRKERDTSAVGRGVPDDVASLFRRLTSVQEDERRRIARDLHDHLGQQLTALRMNLEVFRLQSGLDEARLQQLERTQQLAEELDRSIDFLIWQLRPPALGGEGLATALEELVNSWSERFKFHAQFHADHFNHADVDGDIEENLYRITQEALNNVVKHAKATTVRVRLERGQGVITLVIEDDGCGFDQSTERVDGDISYGLGLVGIRERAALLGGQLIVDSAGGRGTSLCVTVPASDS